MLRRLAPYLVAVLLFPMSALALSSGVVISQVYGGAGCGTAGCSTYKNDYIELFNRGASPVSINGWSVQYAAATGTAWQVTNLPNFTLQPGQYFLVAEGAGANGVNNLPTPDVTGTIAMSATAAKVALVNVTTALSGACPVSATIVDLIGYGATASCSETAVAPAPSTTTADVRGANGCTETDNNSTDFTAAAPNPRNTATTTAPCGGPPPITLNISDVTLAEGDPPGTTTFTFAVTLTAPAGAGVTFDITTADGTAQDDTPATEDNDYVAQTLTGQSIPMGSTGPYNFNVTVNRDTATEPNETFFVNVTNITGATAGDTQGQGTISNDDVSLTPIHDIQGPGASSPIVGATVTTTGIVTGRKSNGYYIQEPDASVDADPATSEGVFVFTSSAPPAAATVGNLVQVTATVVEFVPAADVLQPPLTELSSPTTVQLSTGNPLPAPIPLTATFPDPAGPHDQLERLEGMRVSVASFTAGSGTLGNSTNEANATQSSNGVFYGTVTGVARARREPGIPAPDPAPSGGGTIPPIPRFDSNPELLRVDSDGQTGAAIIDLNTGAVVTGLVGPLDYTFRRYTILPDPPPSPAPVVTGGMTATAATVATGKEFTVAAYNMERFFDTVNDPGIGEPVLTATAYNNRLNKASLGIRNHLRTPDILGVVEVENLTTLQDVATKINNDAVAASQPNPMYVAYLVEGNDVGGIDVGFLVKTAIVYGSTPRVTVNAVVQENAGELFVNPDSSTSILNDRPTLRLDAVVNAPNGATFPVTVMVNHLRSLIDVNSEDPGSNGWSTTGARVRAKRQKQAESLANLVQARQTADPTERIILVGDFNAYEFNDGLVDSMEVIAGTPPPDNETAVPGDGIDLVNPDLDNLFDTPPVGERYSYIFDGQTQNIDHVLVNAPLIAATTARRIEHPRINADFQAIDRNDPNTARHMSDHDPVVGFFEVLAFSSADIDIAKTDSPDPVTAGSNLTYTITVTNSGPDPASTSAWSDTLPAGTTFVSLSTVAGWSCTTPAVGANGTVSCSNPTFAVGSAAFTLVVNVGANVAAGTVLSNTANATSTTGDPDSGDLSATATTTVATSANLQINKGDSPDPVTAGNNLTYQITLTNNGPSHAATASFSDTLPAGTTFVSLSTTGPWTCTTPAVGATGTVSCSNTSFGVTVDFFTLVVAVDPSTAAGTVISNTANLSSATSDPDGSNNGDTSTTTVATSANLQLSKTDSPDPVLAGNNISYQITLTNNGPSHAATASFSDTLPAGTTFVSLSTTGSWTCTTPAVGATGTVSCSNTSFGVTADFFTLVVAVDPSTAAGTVISNTANLSSATPDPDGSNNGDTSTTTVATSADLSVSKVDTPDPVTAGTNLTYTVTVANAGPSDAGNVALADTVPANTTFVSLSSPGGWSCTTPAVGATGSINCTNPTLADGANAVFTLVVNVGAGVSAGTIITNSATVTSTTTDGNSGNETGTATTTVGTGSADLSITKTDSPDPVTAGATIAYTITVNNAGPTNATSASMTDTLPVGTSFASLSSPGGWSCTTPAVGAAGTVTCTNASMALGSAVFTLTVNVLPSVASATVISNTANVTAATTDPNGGNNGATANTTVSSSADLSVTKTDSVDPVAAGANLSYTITVGNAGPSNASTVTLADTLPANTTFVSLSSPGGWSCTTPAVGAAGTINCSNPSLALGNAVFTLVVNVNAGTAGGTVLTNTATVSSTNESTPGNESSTVTTTTSATAGASDVTATKSVTTSGTAGSPVTYSIVITNNMGHTQGNNPGNEFVDVLPSQLTLVSASATSGTAVATVATNTVTWNGSIADGASVTITINAVINPGATGQVNNQGTVNIDLDNNGTNETTIQTAAPGGGGATGFNASANAQDIPSLSSLMLLALAAMLGGVALLKLQK